MFRDSWRLAQYHAMRSMDQGMDVMRYCDLINW